MSKLHRKHVREKRKRQKMGRITTFYTNDLLWQILYSISCLKANDLAKYEKRKTLAKRGRPTTFQIAYLLLKFLQKANTTLICSSHDSPYA